MRAVNIQEAKTHRSRLVAEAARGNSFLIARAGNPRVKVEPRSETEPEPGRRPGFLAAEVAVPDDFDTMGAEQIESLFGDRGR